MQDSTPETIKGKFIEIFEEDPIMVEAPGRINLIGEHTDYNDGYVLPAAIDFTMVFAINKNNRNCFRFYSSDFDSYVNIDSISEIDGIAQWAKYLIGVIAQFEKKKLSISGLDCVFGGNIPVGSGLSSSAALECGFAFGVNELFSFNVSNYELVTMAQKAEHEYAGVMCGIMDQFASVFGRKDKVIQLDCRTHEYKYFEIDMSNHIIALVDTKVKHNLASSEYNKRRQECEEGVILLSSKYYKIKALRDAGIGELNKVRSVMSPAVYKRCNYVVAENHRVIDSCKALEQSDFTKFGEYMYQTHEGLRDEYEVSCKELDILVEATLDMEYVLGSRMMGGGFGGCTINFITAGYEDVFKKNITSIYTNETGIIPEVYFVKLSDGVRIINQ